MSEIQPEIFATHHLLAAHLSTERRRIIVSASGQFDLEPLSILTIALAQAITTGQRDVLLGVDSTDPEDIGLLVRATSLLRARRQHLVVRSSHSAVALLAACALLNPSTGFVYARDRSFFRWSHAIGEGYRHVERAQLPHSERAGVHAPNRAAVGSTRGTNSRSSSDVG